MNIELTLKLKNNKEIKLTLQEAKELHDQLLTLFHRDYTAPRPTYPNIPVPSYPTIPPHPIYGPCITNAEQNMAEWICSPNKPSCKLKDSGLLSD